MIARRAFVAALCLGALPGCANFFRSDQPEIAPQVFVQGSESPREALKSRDFEMSGRFALNWNTQNWIGTLDWNYRPSIETLSLAIAGQQFATFERYENVALANLANGQRYQAKNWGDLTTSTIGVALPFDFAPDWVRGQPANGTPFERETADKFTQALWTIEVLARNDDASVRRVHWRKDRVSFTLVIDRWQAT